MDETKSYNPTPPYLSYVTFKNTIQGFMADGVMPRQIDHSILPGLSGSIRKMFLASLRFFGLTDEAGTPTDGLKTLASADDATWRDCIGTLLKEKYSELVELLPDATPKHFKEEFEKQFSSIGNSLVAPAIRFVVAAATDAGLVVGPHMAKRKVPVSTGRRRSKKAAKHNQSLAADVVDQEPARPADSIALALLQKFPAFDPSWAEDEQKAWFSAYGKLIDMQASKDAK